MRAIAGRGRRLAAVVIVVQALGIPVVATPASSQTPPMASPSGLRVLAASASHIELVWDDLEHETKYEVERSGAVDDWAVVDKPGQNVTNFNDTSLHSGTSYRYRLRAIYGSVYSEYSAPVSATTSPLPTPGPNWTKMPPLAEARFLHQAVSLTPSSCDQGFAPAGYPCGGVLVLGGAKDESLAAKATASGAIFDPRSTTWTTTASMSKSHFDFTATLLDGPLCRSKIPAPHCGRVLVAGGRMGGGGATNTAEIYDPATNSWGLVGPMIRRRLSHTATLLDGPECHLTPPAPAYCGRVLMVGGAAQEGARPPLASAELFLPNKGVFAPAASLNSCAALSASCEKRSNHSATLLGDGKVLVAGGIGTSSIAPLDSMGLSGCDSGADAGCGDRALRSAQIFDPATGAWMPTGQLGVGRFAHTASLLEGPECAGGSPPSYCGDVLVTGGMERENSESDGHHVTMSTELFDADEPGKDGQLHILGGWRAAASTATPHAAHTSTLLPDGEVLIAGGGVPFPLQVDQPANHIAEIYDPALNDWRISHMHGEHGAHSASTLELPACHDSEPPPTCGSVLIVGGHTTGLVLRPNRHHAASANTEVFNPDPTIDLVTPAQGDARGGAIVTIAGTGFNRFSEVLFGDVPAGDVTIESTQKIVAIAPSHTPSTVPVVVKNGALFSRSRASAVYTYLADPGVPAGAKQEEGTGALGKVGDLKATVTSPRDIELAFTAPDDGTGQAATRYVIKQSTEAITESNFSSATSLCGGTCSFEATEPGDRITLAIKDLKASTTYHYAVKALGEGNGEGPMSNVSSATTDPDTIAPSAVTDLEASPMSGAEIALTFSAPASDAGEGPPVTDYVIKQAREPITEATFDSAKTLCDGTCGFTPAAAGEQLSLSVTGLESSSTYHYALKAIDEGGNASLLSNPASATTSEVTPGEVTALEASPKSMSKIVLSFAAADDGTGEAATSYVIKQAKRAIRSEDDFSKAQTLCGGSCRFDATEIGQRLRLAVTGLDPDTTYHYAVRTLDDSGENLGARSTSVEATTHRDRIDPSKVDGLRARALSKTAVKLVFSAAASNGSKGPAVTTYIIKQSTRPIRDAADFRKAQTLCGKVCSFDVAKVGGRLSLKITELSPATTYYYAITAVDAGGNRGPRSNLTKVRTSGR